MFPMFPNHYVSGLYNQHFVVVNLFTVISSQGRAALGFLGFPRTQRCRNSLCINVFAQLLHRVLLYLLMLMLLLFFFFFFFGVWIFFLYSLFYLDPSSLICLAVSLYVDNPCSCCYLFTGSIKVKVFKICHSITDIKHFILFVAIGNFRLLDVRV